MTGERVAEYLQDIRTTRLSLKEVECEIAIAPCEALESERKILAKKLEVYNEWIAALNNEDSAEILRHYYIDGKPVQTYTAANYIDRTTGYRRLSKAVEDLQEINIGIPTEAERKS